MKDTQYIVSITLRGEAGFEKELERYYSEKECSRLVEVVDVHVEKVELDP